MDADRCDLLCIDFDQAEALRAAALPAAAVDRSASRARALGDPTRLALAAVLARAEELCVCDLAWIAGRPQNLVSHHLRLLKSDGLAQSRRDGRMVMYSLTERGRALVHAVLAEAVVAG